MNTLSPPSAGRSSRSSSPSEMSSSASPFQYGQMSVSPYHLANSPMDTTGPYLEILEEPQEKFRFRYRSEMTGTHGCLLADGSEKDRKKYPNVKLHNYRGKALIRVSLCTRDGDLHPHQLETKPMTDEHGNCVETEVIFQVDETNDYTAKFQGMCIIHIPRKKQMKDEYETRLRRRKLEEKQWESISTMDVQLSTKELAEIQKEADRIVKDVHLNCVHLRFEAFSADTARRLPICNSIISRAIYNLKSVQTSELKIVYLSKTSGLCVGDEEVCILVEKVNKKDIKVKFYEEQEDGQEIWSDYGQFTELGVHHQYAIVFRTPQYHTLNITEERKVNVQLYRPTDDAKSEPKEFRYLPKEQRKRPHHARMSQPTHHRESAASPPKIPKQNPAATPVLFAPDVTAPVSESVIGNPTSLPPGTIGQQVPFDITKLLNMNNFEFNQTHQFMPEIKPMNSSSGQNWVSDPNAGYSPTQRSFYYDNYSTIDAQQLNLSQPDIQQFNFPLQQSSDDNCPALEEITLSPEAFDWFHNECIEIDAVGEAKKKGERKAPHKEPVGKKSKDDGQLLSRGSEIDHMNTIPEMMSNLSLGGGKEPPHKDASTPNITDGKHLAMTVARRIAESLQVWAASNNLTVVLERLRHLFTMQTEDGENALHTAVIYQQNEPLAEMLRVLRQFKDCEPMNALNLKNQTPLHLAVKGNQPVMVKQLLEAGANPGIVDETGNTAIHMAVKLDHGQCLEQLLNEKIYSNRLHPTKIINVANHEPGSSALHIAVRNEKLDLVIKLCRAHADVNLQDRSQGNTALHIAVEKMNVPIVKYLVEKAKAQVNSINYSGNTPLHVACDLQHEELCLLLMFYGANPHIENYIRKGDGDGESDGDEEKYVETKEDHHTAFDFAGDNKTLLSILRKEYRLCREEEAEENLAQAAPVKSKDCQGKSEMDSGIDIQSRELTSRSVEILDNITRQKLSQLLDPPSDMWKKLIRELDWEYLFHVIEKQKSPTSWILNNLDTNDVSLERLHSALEELGASEAAQLIDDAFTH